MNSKNHIGTLYGVGVGPGNPEWITLQAARILRNCKHVFAPRSARKEESLALEIARTHLSPDASIQELTFPMSKNAGILEEAWNLAADQVELILKEGEDACFLTLGDCMLYSTFLYLRRILEKRIPDLNCEAIPGIPAFVAAASLTGIPLGEGRQPLVIIPASGDLARVDWALDSGGTVVVMKVGDRMEELRNTLQKHQLPQTAILASKVGLKQQQLIPLDATTPIPTNAAYLSLALIPANSTEANCLKEDK